MTIRGLLFRLLAIALSLGLVLAFAEVTARFLRSDGGFVGTAVDAAGRGASRNLPDFRGRPKPGRKEAGVFRVLVMGDSFVWGDGVYAEDAYPRRLERRLAELESEYRFEVISWSRAGWNTRQIWNSLEPRLAWLKPDLMLLGFTLNDPEPSSRQDRARLEAPLPRHQPRATWSRALHRSSALYRLFWERVESRRQRRAFDAYYEGLYDGPQWDDCRQAMRELRRAAADRGVPLVLVVMPVFDSQLDGSYSYRRLHGVVAAAAAELGIPVLDLLQAFERIDARRLAVEPFTDPHPSELAHRISADEILDYLVDNALVPASFPRTGSGR